MHVYAGMLQIGKTMDTNYGAAAAGAVLLAGAGAYPRQLAPAILLGGCAGLGLITSISMIPRVVVVVVAIIIVAITSHGDGAIGVPAVVLALASATVREASLDMWLVKNGLDVAVMVAALAWALTTHTISRERIVAAVEFCFWAVVLGVPEKIGPKSRHMTWWGISVLAAHLFCVAFGSRRALQTTQSVVAGSVLVGTWAMSLARCHVLTAAIDGIGPIGYIFGNFALHYYPVSRACTMTPDTVDANGALIGVALVATYTVSLNAVDVYGCNGIHAAAPVLGIPASAVATMFAMLG